MAGGAAIAFIAYLIGHRAGADGSAPRAEAISMPPASSPSPPVATRGAAADAAVLTPLGSPTSAADLFTRLQTERDTRPKLEPTADSVFAAMKTKLGVQVDEELQVAGFVVGARYCDKVRTKKDVHVVVCEFGDEAAAIKGVDYGENKGLKGREVLRNKTTTCAVYAADGKGAAEAASIEELFKAM